MEQGDPREGARGRAGLHDLNTTSPRGLEARTPGFARYIPRNVACLHRLCPSSLAILASAGERRSRLRKVAVLASALAVATALFAGGPAHAQSLPEDVERELNCVCGCSINFEDCVCDTATAIRESAAGMLETERTTLEVLDGLVAQYGEEVLLSFDGSSSTSTPDADPIVVDPDAEIAIIEPDPATVAPTPDAGAIPGAIGGGSSNIMTWLLPLLGAVGGGAAVLVAVQVVRQRREPALATQQARRRQDRRKAKRGSRR